MSVIPLCNESLIIQATIVKYDMDSRGVPTNSLSRVFYVEPLVKQDWRDRGIHVGTIAGLKVV